MELIERLHDSGIDLALILRAKYQAEGIEFFTPNSYSQQLGYMKRDAGYKIQPHLHKPVLRQVEYTNEVLFIKSGKVKVSFYSEAQRFLFDRILEEGDIILLIRGGHGFHFLEPSEIIEVKQGPYAGDEDKQRF